MMRKKEPYVNLKPCHKCPKKFAEAKGNKGSSWTENNIYNQIMVA